MVQQQQQQMAQMYPKLHASHFSNPMISNQFLSPVYVPPMPVPLPVPGYSNSPAYPHPSGNNSCLSPSGLKYCIQQFKPVPFGVPTGFSNFTSAPGYAINAHGPVGSTAGHEDSHVPNPQVMTNYKAETSESLMNQMDLPNLQFALYYDLRLRTPHAADFPSHSGHTSFNAAAAAAQSLHMQFEGRDHPSQQPTAIASPYYLGNTIVGNVGVGVAAPAPGAQVGACHQRQLGHLNLIRNF